MDRNLACHTLKGILALDRPIGLLMEIVGALEDSPEKTALKECCGTLLSLQFDLIERLRAAYPELDEDSGSENPQTE